MGVNTFVEDRKVNHSANCHMSITPLSLCQLSDTDIIKRSTMFDIAFPANKISSFKNTSQYTYIIITITLAWGSRNINKCP